MSGDARAKLEISQEGRLFLELVEKCPDTQLAAQLVAAGARLVGIASSAKENVTANAVDLSSVLLSVKALSFINPRGKFDLAFCKEALCITNAKVNVVVPTSAVTHVAILDQIPGDSKKRCLLFIVLNKAGPAVMNGKQRLEALIIQTLESDSMSATAANGEVLEGPVAAVLCQALGMSIPSFTNFLAPDPDLFRSAKGHTAVPAVVKVSPGLLFPLPGAVLFAERPALFLPHADVLAVEIRRPQSATFDLVLHARCRSGEGSESLQQVEFSQVDRGELGRLQSYFAASKVKLYDPAAPPRLGPRPLAAPAGGAAAGSAAVGAVGPGGEAEEEEEEEEDEDDEEDEDFDPTALERREAGLRPAKRMRTGPSGSVAASNLLSAAGASGGRDARMRDAAAGEEEVQGAGGEEEEAEDDSEDSEEDSEEDEDSYDEEEELADLTDEDDVRADVVRQRARRAGGPSSGRGGAVSEEAEEEEEEDDD